MAEPKDEITGVLGRWYGGQTGALDDLIPLVYDELRLLARRTFQKGPRVSTLEPTALVHELYQRLASSTPGSYQDRSEFFAMVAKKMREILIQHFRARTAEKRGGKVRKVNLDGSEKAGDPGTLGLEDIVGLHLALERLDRINRRQRMVSELRYFGGLTLQETADALDISLAQVKRDWRTAQLWLASQLKASHQSRESKSDDNQICNSEPE